MPQDARLIAFLNSPAEVFNSVAAVSEVWTYDPMDVEALHAKARQSFRRLLDKATTPSTLIAGAEPQIQTPGRVLLLTGPAGAGKTHLIRAFRNTVHDEGLGYVGYLQLTTATTHYTRYVLGNLIDSLSQPYNHTYEPTTSLMQLATALARNCGNKAVQELLLNCSDRDPADVAQGVEKALELLCRQPRYQGVDLNLLRVLLFLHRHDQITTMRVMRYLRCEPLTPTDSQALGGIVTAAGDEAPERMLVQLGELVRSVGRSLVICIDQLEGTIDEALPADAFRRLVQTVCNLAGQIRGSIFVVACLSDFYDVMRPQLTRALIDRIELNPPRQYLSEICTPDQAELLVQARLKHLYELTGARFDPADPLYPLRRDEVRQKLGGRRSRDIISTCLQYRQRAQDEGALPAALFLQEAAAPSLPAASPPAPTADPLITVEQRWNDFRARWQQAPSTADSALAELLAWALTSSDRELGPKRLQARQNGDYIEANHTTAAGVQQLAVLVSNADPRGGWLGKHVDALEQFAKERQAVFIRTEAFPSNPKTQIRQKLEAFKKRAGGGRCVVMQDADLRAMAALRAFEKDPPAQFDEWRSHYRPLLRLPSLQAVLDFETMPPAAPAQPPKPAPPPSPAPTARTGTQLIVGQLASAKTSPVTIELDSLRKHAVFLGASGSGKTTLALNVVEQLLLAGVPAVLVDRKGDLAVYAQEAAWTKALADPAQTARRKQLREKVDVALFTPGHPGGRPLSISLLPQQLLELPAEDRSLAVEAAAHALAGLLKLKSSARENAVRALLVEAVKTLVALQPKKLDLEVLIDFVQDRDPALVEAAKAIEDGTYKDLAVRLGTLRLNMSGLVAVGGEPLDPELLFGRGQHAQAGRTRLSIVSTKFLSDPDHVQLWVSQMLMELARWTSRHPSHALQGVVLFDEADVYLPATSKPPTKDPMENLLKRARSAGLGLLLATQSPGDFDYRCREQVSTWFVGKVKENTALEKLKPMLAQAPEHVLTRIPNQGQGEFHLAVDGQATMFVGARSCLDAVQLSEAELPKLAAATKRGG
jgi:energy-coupling factor transporter ATP-binding protein EcfA2